jgi:putative hemolysin
MGKDEMTASHGSGGRMSEAMVIFSFSLGLAFAPPPAWALPNPASVFCVKSGGKSECVKGPAVCTVSVGFPMAAWSRSGPIFTK